MAKFTQGQLKKSLLENITLIFKEDDDNDFKWVEFHEIEDYIEKGYYIFNKEKREYYAKIN